MRYSSALVLGTAGIAAAGNLRHASFHARRQAEASKRDADNVDWSKVSYDLTNVNWGKVFTSTPIASPVDTPTPTPTPSPVVSSAATPAVEAVSTSTSAAASVVKPSSSPVVKPSSTSAAAPATTSKPADTPSLGGILGDLLEGVDSIVSALGIKGVGTNDKADNGGLWIGDDGAWKTEFTNDASSDVVVFCWEANGFSGMSLNANVPAISVGLKQGESVTVSFKEGVPAACAPAFSTTKLSNFGGIDNTWYEATFGSSGAFDISRNVNMNGNNISAKGSKCVSNMDSCVFKCSDASLSSCETGYTLAGMDSTGCGGGYDSVMQGVGGGCSVGADGETVKVTFS